MVLQIMRRTDLEPVIQNNTNNEIVEQSLSSEKARTLLGWIPQYSLEKGLEETVSWYRGYLEEWNEPIVGRTIPAIASTGGA
jgi:CDP-glucose 4,6-dehydratase